MGIHHRPATSVWKTIFRNRVFKTRTVSKRTGDAKKAFSLLAMVVCIGVSSSAQTKHPFNPGPDQQAHSTNPIMNNQEVLTTANAAIATGDYEGYLAFCAENSTWTFEGEQQLIGKEAIRQYMKRTYRTPPVFTTDKMIGSEDHVIAMGMITLLNAQGRPTKYSYCDVWRFKDGKMIELNAYVVEAK
jgi:ketosteroid isomerase-like protein